MRWGNTGIPGIQPAADGTPGSETPYEFHICSPGRKRLLFTVRLRLSVSAQEDERPDFTKEFGDAIFIEALLKWAVRRIEEGLRDGSLGPSNTLLELTHEDFPLLWEIARQKQCAYQVREGRDLFCSAAAGPTALQVGLRTFYRTSVASCLACDLPDSDYLCRNLSHPKISDPTISIGALVNPSVDAGCDAREEGYIREPIHCHAGGHPCWEKLIEPTEEDQPPSYVAPMLTRILDLLDTTWRLRFGKEQGLVGCNS